MYSRTTSVVNMNAKNFIKCVRSIIWITLLKVALNFKNKHESQMLVDPFSATEFCNYFPHVKNLKQLFLSYELLYISFPFEF